MRSSHVVEKRAAQLSPREYFILRHTASVPTGVPWRDSVLAHKLKKQGFLQRNEECLGLFMITPKGLELIAAYKGLSEDERLGKD